MKKRLLTRAAFVFAALIASQAAHAAGPIVASGSATLSNIQLTFSDFRPDDGMAAGVSWARPGSGWIEVDCCDYSTTQSRRLNIQGDRFNNRVENALSLPGNTAHANRTSNGAQAGFVVDADHIGLIYDGGKNDRDSSLYAQADVSLSGHELVLKPGTEIQLSGQAHLEATLNLLNTTAYGMPGSRDVAAVVQGEARLRVESATGSNDLDFVLAPQGSDGFASGALNQIKSAGLITSGDTTLNIDRSFNYVIRNTGTSDQTLYFSLRSGITFSGFYADAVSSVPEPETFALLMAGLASMFWAARRRQRSRDTARVAAACLVATVLPLGAQAAPLVSAEGAIKSEDVLGKTQGGFAIDDTSEPFNYTTTGESLFINPGLGLQSYPYALGELITSAGSGPQGFGVAIQTYEPDFYGEEYYNLPAPLVSASAKLDWSDTIVNTDAQKRGVFMDFSMPSFRWGLDDTAHFKASIWIEGQSSPVWFTGLDRAFDPALGRSATVFSGKDIGLRGDGGVGSLALSQQVYLGSLAEAEAFKVHFTVEISGSGTGLSMYFSSSAPSFRLVTSPVPEPSGWLLSLAGLGLAAWAARRRQVATPLARGQQA